MRSGDLNQRVMFQRAVKEDDGAGGYIETWAGIGEAYAQFSPERARERVQSGRTSSYQAGVLRVRSSAKTRTVTAQDRVVIGCTSYNIRAVINPDQRNDMLEMAVDTDGT